MLLLKVQLHFVHLKVERSNEMGKGIIRLPRKTRSINLSRNVKRRRITRPSMHIQIANVVRKEIRNQAAGGPENKFQAASVIELVPTALTTAWTNKENATMLSVSGVAQGDTESTRDGRVYHITDCFIKGLIVLPSVESATAPPNEVQVGLK